MEISSVSNWYIVYTKKSYERKVADLCFKKKLEHYFPLKGVKRQFAEGIKTTSEPLFASYFFVRATPGELCQIKKIREVISIVYWLGKPAIIREEEIAAIKKFLNNYTDVELEKIPVSPNGRISISYDSIKKAEIISEVMNTTIKVQLPSLGYILKAQLTRQHITVIDSPQTENIQQLYTQAER